MSGKKQKPTVPLLEISDESGSTSTRKPRQSRRFYYSHKMGAGYKSRYSDIERWQLYVRNEHRWISSGANFRCPFRYLSPDAFPADAPSEAEKNSALARLDCSFMKEEKLRCITLKEFNIPPFSEESSSQWEKNMRQKIMNKRKVKGEDKEFFRPKLRHQRSKLDILKEALPSASSSKSENATSRSDLVVTHNPLITMLRPNDREKFAVLLGFTRLGEGYSSAGPEYQYPSSPVTRRSVTHEGNGSQEPSHSKKSKFRNTLRRGFRSTSKFPPGMEGEEEPSLTNSGQLLMVPGTEKSVSSSPKNSLRNSGYRTAERKRKRQPVSASSIFPPTPEDTPPESLTRVRSQSSAVPPEIIKAAMSNSKRDLPAKESEGTSSGSTLLHTSTGEHAA